MHRSDIRRDPERYALIKSLVDSHASLTEIRKSTGCDYRTVKRNFPEYEPWPVGGGGEAAVVREVNRKLRELDRTGRVQQNRDSGMRPRRDVL